MSKAGKLRRAIHTKPAGLVDLIQEDVLLEGVPGWPYFQEVRHRGLNQHTMKLDELDYTVEKLAAARRWP